MGEQIILDLPAFLGWSFLVLVNGMFLGCGTYAFCCEVWKQAGFAPVDHDKAQTKADELWAPVRAYTKQELLAKYAPRTK